MSEWEYWQRQFAAGRITRREWLGRAAALGATAVLMPAALTGAAQAVTPTQGGFARFGFADGSQTDSLDPATWPGTFTLTALGGAMCNNLTEILPDRSVAGDLAESYEASDSSKKWAFQLRKGVTFHNGKTLTTADVVELIRHHTGLVRSPVQRLCSPRLPMSRPMGRTLWSSRLNKAIPTFPT